MPRRPQQRKPYPPVLVTCHTHTYTHTLTHTHAHAHTVGTGQGSSTCVTWGAARNTLRTVAHETAARLSHCRLSNDDRVELAPKVLNLCCLVPADLVPLPIRHDHERVPQLPQVSMLQQRGARGRTACQKVRRPIKLNHPAAVAACRACARAARARVACACAACRNTGRFTICLALGWLQSLSL